jgi:hypothetical protein
MELRVRLMRSLRHEDGGLHVAMLDKRSHQIVGGAASIAAIQAFWLVAPEGVANFTRLSAFASRRESHIRLAGEGARRGVLSARYGHRRLRLCSTK